MRKGWVSIYVLVGEQSNVELKGKRLFAEKGFIQRIRDTFLADLRPPPSLMWYLVTQPWSTPPSVRRDISLFSKIDYSGQNEQEKLMKSMFIKGYLALICFEIWSQNKQNAKIEPKNLEKKPRDTSANLYVTFGDNVPHPRPHPL